ncbi:hypothetical protein BDY24DRAFT_443635 [Mrakia frigida]|uniref:uncharacterized protein n=1 Tax=Mrakia frigida TaxID=29902 RepID=UPI003FCBFB43
MAPKRKAPEVEDAPKPVERYSPIFPLYPEADLVVKTALFLRAVSPVFDDILSLPAQEEHEKKDRLPLLKASGILEMFLRWAQRDRLLVNGQPPQPPGSTVLLLPKAFLSSRNPDEPSTRQIVSLSRSLETRIANLVLA